MNRSPLCRLLAATGLAVAILIAAATTGCGGGNTTPAPTPTPTPTPSPQLTVFPSNPTVHVGASQQFTATVMPGGANQGVTWSVSGTGCMGASCGTIDTAGKYTAPATVPGPVYVTITARSVVDTTTGTATVWISTGPIVPLLELSVAPDPSGKFGKFAYVANAGSNKIAMFSIDGATGALTAIGTVDAVPSPSSIAIDTSGRFAYVTNAGGGVSMYAIDAATGTLTSTGTVAAEVHSRFGGGGSLWQVRLCGESG